MIGDRIFYFTRAPNQVQEQMVNPFDFLADQVEQGQKEWDINLHNRRNQTDDRAIFRANWPRAAKILPDDFKEMSEEDIATYISSGLSPRSM